MSFKKAKAQFSNLLHRYRGPMAPTAQAAALPWRDAANGIEVLLMTSLTTGRWVLPKGWPEAGETLGEAAQREAFEEAGLIGAVADAPLGSYRYSKRRKNGPPSILTVEVFTFQTAGQARDWPEKARRRQVWVTPQAASTMVAEADLSHLLSAFARAAHGYEKQR